MNFQSDTRAPSDFKAKWILNAVSKRQKNSQIIVSIFDTITPERLNRSARYIISCYVFALFLYNESVMISSLTYNICIHIHFQC